MFTMYLFFPSLKTVCFTFMREAENRKYLFVGLEVMNADSPTGGDWVVLGGREGDQCFLLQLCLWTKTGKNK